MTAQPEVVFDARWLRTGIGRYIFTLLSDLRHHLAGLTLTCIAQLTDAERLAPLCDRVIPFESGIYTLSEQIVLPRIASNAAVFCAPHYNLPVLRTAPTIVTIHDITHVVYPQYARSLRSRLYALPMLKAACARAARIAVPSAYTKRMLIERLGGDPDKIAVIPCAIAPIFHPVEKSHAAQLVKLQFRISEPYLVCVTSTAPHKNLATLVAAYRNLRARSRDLPQLVLVLPESQPRVQSGDDLHSLFADPAIHCLHDVTDSGLAALYSAAFATIVPSFEEGFGYPAVESMACGTPVVCSSSASLPEVAAGCAEFFSPNSPEELEQAICRVLESSALRRDLTVKGLERAATFTPGQTACDYATLVRSVIQDRSAAPAQLPALPASLGDQ
jgi:alpha-1,3-rhamnosyl/mannosyltransferase